MQGTASNLGKGSKSEHLLERVFSYKDSVNYSLDSVSFNVYTYYSIATLKKNKLLKVVPSMYTFTRGKETQYAGESYSRFTLLDNERLQIVRQVSVSTLPHQKTAFPSIMEYMAPGLYNVTLLNNRLLSPFHKKNRIFYRYSITELTMGRVEIVFRPKKYNTQVVSGSAIVENATGRIISVDFSGEYDMIHFKVSAEMGDTAPLSLFPQKTDLEATFSFVGNKIKVSYHSVYHTPITLPDSIIGNHSRILMDSLRPIPLPLYEQQLFSKYDSIMNITDSLNKGKIQKEKQWKDIFWKAVGNNLVNRIKGSFGTNDQGSFRISPILNPLYVGYSHRKGITYKMKIRTRYAFTNNSDISLYARLGYSFKNKQFFFRLPLKYTYNAQKNGFVELEVGNGNRIFNNSVFDRIKEEKDSSVWKDLKNLDYFKDTYIKLRTNHDLNNYFSIGTGFTFHKRSAVDQNPFAIAGSPTTYCSFAPVIECNIRPWGWNGPIFVFNYEQGLKGLSNSSMKYGRIEADANWLKNFSRMRSFSARFGMGFYTMKDKDAYFLDFENFREENLPGGWNDDWTGEFQVLNSEDYNKSNYYIRTNLTYESPLMFLSNLPILGHFIEMERVYVNTLFARDNHPYMELGYGLTNRVFSIGLFVATKNNKYDGVGCRIGLELFRDW